MGLMGETRMCLLVKSKVQHIQLVCTYPRDVTEHQYIKTLSWFIKSAQNVPMPIYG